MDALITLPKTLGLIKKCWLLSEEKVCKLISDKYHVHDEVFNEYNKSGQFEKCFLSDLTFAFDNKKLWDEVKRLSKGIIAHISYHEPKMEKFSGADFGLAVIRPNFQKTENNRLKHSMHQQGLLCQAKRQTLNGGFGNLTERQRKMVPDHLDYFVILLYRYSDKDRKILLPFNWSNCEWEDIEDIKDFLNNYMTDEIIKSGELLTLLGEGKIGTNNQSIIKSFICPEDMPYIKIEITWSDGPPPQPDAPPPFDLHSIIDLKENSQNINLHHRPQYNPNLQHIKMSF